MHKSHDLGTQLTKIQMVSQAISLAINCDTITLIFSSIQNNFVYAQEDNYMEIFLNEVIIYFAKKEKKNTVLTRRRGDPENITRLHDKDGKNIYG